MLAKKENNARANLLAETLDRAMGRWLEDDRSPSRQVGELDNRGSHFYLALYWARELADQEEDEELASQFESLTSRLTDAEEQIVEELASVQGSSVDIGGYYWPDRDQMEEAMRPSRTFNDALEQLRSATA
jgi:isocitrate dehydrogenase